MALLRKRPAAEEQARCVTTVHPRVKAWRTTRVATFGPDACREDGSAGEGDAAPARRCGPSRSTRWVPYGRQTVMSSTQRCSMIGADWVQLENRIRLRRRSVVVRQRMFCMSIFFTPFTHRV